MMLDQRTQFATNLLCTTTGGTGTEVSVSALKQAVDGGQQLYLDIVITESLTVATPAADRNFVSWKLSLSDAGITAGAFNLGISDNVYNVGSLVLGLFDVLPIGTAGTHLVIPINPFNDAQIDAMRRMKLNLALVPDRLFLAHTVTNEAGAGLTGGRYSAALTLNPTSRLGIQHLADAVN